MSQQWCKIALVMENGTQTVHFLKLTKPKYDYIRHEKMQCSTFNPIIGTAWA